MKLRGNVELWETVERLVLAFEAQARHVTHVGTVDAILDAVDRHLAAPSPETGPREWSVDSHMGLHADTVVVPEGKLLKATPIARPAPEAGTAAPPTCKECRCPWPGPHAQVCSLGDTASETESWKFAAGPAPEPVKPPATLVVQVGVGPGCWQTVKEPMRHADNSVSYLGVDGKRYSAGPNNWRSNGDVPMAIEPAACELFIGTGGQYTCETSGLKQRCPACRQKQVTVYPVCADCPHNSTQHRRDGTCDVCDKKCWRRAADPCPACVASRDHRIDNGTCTCPPSQESTK